MSNLKLKDEAYNSHYNPPRPQPLGELTDLAQSGKQLVVFDFKRPEQVDDYYRSFGLPIQVPANLTPAPNVEPAPTTVTFRMGSGLLHHDGVFAEPKLPALTLLLEPLTLVRYDCFSPNFIEYLRDRSGVPEALYYDHWFSHHAPAASGNGDSLEQFAEHSLILLELFTTYTQALRVPGFEVLHCSVCLFGRPVVLCRGAVEAVQPQYELYNHDFQMSFLSADAAYCGRNLGVYLFDREGEELVWDAMGNNKMGEDTLEVASTIHGTFRKRKLNLLIE